jgi:hypothetical protein
MMALVWLPTYIFAVFFLAFFFADDGDLEKQPDD